MRILNLYAGIGGNRKLWGDEHEITSVEVNKSIAEIYMDFYPKDTVVISDAHKYLLDHYGEFDFIWSSPPCQTHSRTMYFNHIKKRFPDLKLYEEIIFLQNFFNGLFCVENVKSYYQPLIRPQETERHYFWSNFKITDIAITKKVRNDIGETLDKKMKERGIVVNDFKGYRGDKRILLNNCIEPELGLHILNCAMGNHFSIKTNQQVLF